MSTKSFKQQQSELDEILSRFEHSEHEDVDELLKDYEKAMKLIESLDNYLKKAEISIKKIKLHS